MEPDTDVALCGCVARDGKVMGLRVLLLDAMVDPGWIVCDD